MALMASGVVQIVYKTYVSFVANTVDFKYFFDLNHAGHAAFLTLTTNKEKKRKVLLKEVPPTLSRVGGSSKTPPSS